MYDLVCTTRLAYLKWSMTKEYGHEILFVGSGGVFEYTSGDRLEDRLHVELRTLLRAWEDPPAPRFRPSRLRKALSRVKQGIKRAIGKDEKDLYDLVAWTVFSDGS